MQSSNLEVKDRAFNLSLGVMRYLDTLPNKTSVLVVSKQLIRAITSIGANIVEAKSSSSRREFVNYFQIALKSGNETVYWLKLLNELVNEKDKINQFIVETEEICRILGASVMTLKKSL